MLEQHPVPQNVTTFQFRLIGDMTIKQFGYLAGGAILGYISFNLPLPFFFRYPLTGIFVLGGIGFAFVPIEERPMDVWFLSFIRSIYSPTQYLWQREAYKPAVVAAIPNTTSTAAAKPNIFASLFDFSFLTKPKSGTVTAPTIDKQEPTHPTIPQVTAPISMPTPIIKKEPPQEPSWISTMFKPSSQKVTSQSSPAPSKTQTPPAPVMASSPIPSVDGVHLDLPTPQTPAPNQAHEPSAPKKEEDPRVKSMEQRLKEMEEQLKRQETSKNQMNQLQEQLVGALSEKEKLEKQLEEMHRTLTKQQKTPEVMRTPGSAASNRPQAQPTVNVFTPEGARSAGIPMLTTFANVITGIVRERTGNLLVGILVTVKDKEDIPVRALKTNKLGQFAASTPLTPDTYLLEIEDPKGQFSFDHVKVVLNGTVLPPIEIIAKSKQELERQKLEQAIFGKQNM